MIEKLANALHTLRDHLLREDPIIFLELTEEYLLGGLISVSADNIVEIVRAIMEKMSDEHKNRTLMALFSMYFTYYLTTNTLIPNLLILAMQTIQ